MKEIAECSNDTLSIVSGVNFSFGVVSALLYFSVAGEIETHVCVSLGMFAPESSLFIATAICSDSRMFCHIDLYF